MSVSGIGQSMGSVVTETAKGVQEDMGRGDVDRVEDYNYCT